MISSSMFRLKTPLLIASDHDADVDNDLGNLSCYSVRTPKFDLEIYAESAASKQRSLRSSALIFPGTGTLLPFEGSQMSLLPVSRARGSTRMPVGLITA